MSLKKWASENGVFLGLKICIASSLIMTGIAGIATVSSPYGSLYGALLIFCTISTNDLYFALTLFLTALFRPDKKEHMWRTIIMCVIALWLASGALFPLLFLLQNQSGARGANKGFAYLYMGVFAITGVVFLFFYLRHWQKRKFKAPNMLTQTPQNQPPTSPPAVPS